MGRFPIRHIRLELTVNQARLLKSDLEFLMYTEEVNAKNPDPLHPEKAIASQGAWVVLKDIHDKLGKLGIKSNYELARERGDVEV